MSLQVYNEKRNFKKTREPRGEKMTGKSKHLSFVIQEHHASHLHYDFRLELDGVLKSWAVPKGPSFNPKDKRLAVEVEDHPLEYGKFSGTIPEGEYGAGEVYIWDKGYWEPIGDPHKSLKKGHLEFKIHGAKMKGAWLLVRTRATSSGKNQWLLIKRTDSVSTEAEPGPSFLSEDPVEEKKIHRASRAAPKKAQATKRSTRKTKKLALPDFIPMQMALLVDHPPEGPEWFHEIKFDGYRIEAILDFSAARKKKVELKTRNANNWTRQFAPIAEALKKIKVKNAILDGEVVVLDEQGRSDFQLLQNTLKNEAGDQLIYQVFDILFLNGEDLRELPLRERKDILKEILKNTSDPIRYTDDMEASGVDMLKASCRLELEGIISKKTDSTYASNRNGTWTKSKCKLRQEFVIGGYTDPQGERSGFGALLLGAFENGKFRYVGRVGTGFDSKGLGSLSKKLKSLEQEDSPFEVKSPRGRTLHWVEPKLVAEIEFGNWTQDQVLRVPVFQGLREDKPAKEVGIEKPHHVEEVESAAPTKSPTISHPDKIIFKKEKITKGEIAAYYQQVAPLMVPLILDRPLSILRCPNGSTGTCFFQKHDPHDLENIQAVSITEKHGAKDYMTIESIAGLMSLAQMGTIEIHPWNCRAPHIEYPDQIVMDFDPGEKVPWKKVVAAAFELKDILDDLNLVSFLKVTGGKGLHVHIPVATVYSWEQIKSFSHTLATELASRRPDLYTTDMSKKIRANKIFLDYLRNGRGSTAVAPYSLRAKALSAVALPIEWAELKKIPSSNFFTIAKALEKIKKRKSDPWKDYAKHAQKISILKEA